MYIQVTGEIDITDLDDEELDSYIMSEKEAQFKSNLWNKVNEKYLLEQKGRNLLFYIFFK
jgi:transcription factor IIIB subunit 2